MITLPGDQELLEKVQSGAVLTEEENKRYEQIEASAREELKQQAGEEKLKEFAEKFVIQDDLNSDFVKGFKSGIQFAVNGLASLPRYQISIDESGQSALIVPSDAANSLQLDLTLLAIVYEDALEELVQ